MHCRQQRTELAFGKLNWWCLSWRKKSRLQSPVSPLPLIHTFTCTCISTLDLPSVTLAFTGMYGHGTKVSFGLGFNKFFHFFKNSYVLPILHQSTSNYTCSNFFTRTSLTNHLLWLHSVQCLPFHLLSTESSYLPIFT